VLVQVDVIVIARSNTL